MKGNVQQHAVDSNNLDLIIMGQYTWICMLGLLAAFCGMGLCLQDREAVVILTDEDFDQKTSAGVWMIDIYAPWYGGVTVLAFCAAGGCLIYIMSLCCQVLTLSATGANLAGLRNGNEAAWYQSSKGRCCS